MKYKTRSEKLFGFFIFFAKTNTTIQFSGKEKRFIQYLCGYYSFIGKGKSQVKAIFRKEINVFFSSLIGYLAITIFLITNGLISWIFPDTNIFDGGYAVLDTFFIWAPWVFLFLIPAITMRSFAEEKNSGTIEFLVTRPLTDMQIILGKYFSACVLVLFSIIPTILYFITIKELASPKGNVDTGGIIGAYIGLLLTGCTFVSISIFTSSVSNNQIVAFIAGMFACFFFHYGFDAIAQISVFVGSADKFFNAISINQHYQNISKGYIDLRDVWYFISLSFIFLFMTKTSLASRKW